MTPYSKIQSIFKRDEKTHQFIDGKWALPEFEYLQNNEWDFTEKVDGTNIRIIWDKEVKIGGRTDNAQISLNHLEYYKGLFPVSLMTSIFDSPICLYGEGFGAGIQKGGKYRDSIGFVLFDIKIGPWWLERSSLEEIAKKLGIEIVPIVGRGTIHDAIKLIKRGIESTWGSFLAEGLVLRPKITLQRRNGERLLTKIKHKDFKKKEKEKDDSNK